MGASQGTYWIMILLGYFFIMGVLNSVVGIAFIGSGLDNPVVGSQTTSLAGLDAQNFSQEFNTTETTLLESLNPFSRVSPVIDVIKLVSGFYIYIALPFPLNLAFGFFFIIMPIILLIASIYNLFPTVN